MPFALLLALSMLHFLLRIKEDAIWGLLLSIELFATPSQKRTKRLLLVTTLTLCRPEEILEMIHMSKVIVFLCQKKCQIWSECRKCQHLIATEIGITKISSNHSTKVCGAIDGIHYCCSSYALQVEDGSQIDQEIGYCADSFSFSNVSLPENFTQNLKKKKKLTKEYIKQACNSLHL